MISYRAQGKQVLQNGEHFADAAGELEAMMIVNALRALEERVTTHHRRPLINLNNCQMRRESDEFACRCGLRWSVDDPDPPLCAHRGR
jgi:hypothetical protein